MACDCIARMDELLRPHNTRLGLTISFGRDAAAYLTIMTEQIERGRGKPKAVAMLPTFCPFCGTSYQAAAEAEAVSN